MVGIFGIAMSGLGLIEFSNFGEPDLVVIEFSNFGGSDLDVIEFSNFRRSRLGSRRPAKIFRGNYERTYVSKTTAEFDVCTICRVTENPGLSADPFDFPVPSSAPQRRSAGRLPLYHPLHARRIRQCKLNRWSTYGPTENSDSTRSQLSGPRARCGSRIPSDSI